MTPRIDATVYGYLDLRALPMARSQITAALAAGALVRLRRDRYMRGDAPDTVKSAVRMGARLDCISLLALLGVFVREQHGLHVQFTRSMSRLPPRGAKVIAHWRCTGAAPSSGITSIIEALAQACRCQRLADAVATLDSALHLGLIGEAQLAEVFALLPRRFGVLRPLLDARSESGPETLVRLMLRMLGARVETQVDIVGVGRVDLLVNGWLIVECDSRAFHADWESQRRDRRRDREAARRGYVTLRLIAQDILSEPDAVRDALRGVLRAGIVRG